MALTKIPASLLDTSGGLDLQGNITLGDSEQIQLGADGDLAIYHSGAHSYIDDGGTGNLYIRNGTKNSIFARTDGEVILYHNDSPKIATSSTGATVTGDLAVTGDLNITGNVNSASVTDLDVTDKTITLGAGQTEALSGGSGIIIDGSNASILWDETNTEFDINNTINVTGAVVSSANGAITTANGTTARFSVNETGGAITAMDARGSTGNIGTRSNHTLGFLVNDVQKATLTAGGDFTVTNDLKLTTTNPRIDYDGGNSGALRFFSTSAAQERARITSSGKMIIGDVNTDTTDALQIQSPASGGGYGIQLRRDDSNADQQMGRILFGNNTNNDLAQIAAKTDGSTDNSAIFFSTRASGNSLTERMRIDSSGRVVIQDDVTYTANAPTHRGSLILAGASGFANYGGLEFHTSSGGGAGYGTRVVSSDATMLFGRRFNATGWTESMRIDDNGHIIINKESFSSLPTGSKLNIFGDGVTLRLDGSSNTTKSILFRGTSVGDPGEVYADGSLRFRTEDASTRITFHTNSSGTNNERMRIDSSGNVGIAQNTPQYPIHYGESTVIPNGRNLNWDGGEIFPAHQYLAVSQTSNASDNRPTAIGLQLYNESNTVNTFAPAISWSHQSTSTNFSQSSAAIAGRRTNAISGDTNWHGGELHLYTARDSSPIGLRDTASFIINKDAQAHLGGGEADTRLYLGNTGGLFGGNSSNWIRGSNSNLMLNAAGGDHIFEISGVQKFSIDTVYTKVTTNGSDGYNLRAESTAGGDPGLSMWRAGLAGFGINVRTATTYYADLMVSTGGEPAYNPGGSTNAPIRLYQNNQVSMPHSASWSSGIGNIFSSTGSHYMVRNANSVGNESIIINNTTSGGSLGILQYRITGGVQGQYLIGQSGTGITFTGSSDYRLKENVSTITESSLDKINQLRLVSYNWNDLSDMPTDTTEIGVIAHEIQEVFPEFVDGEKDAVYTQEEIDARGDPETTNEEVGDIKPQTVSLVNKDMIVHILKAMQELKAENDALRARIEVLESN
jgi:hypothetical protein